MHRTLEVVARQIEAMGGNVFEIGAYKLVTPEIGKREPEMIPRTWDRESLLKSVSWLRLQNSHGRNIYVRPKGEHALSLVDDLNAAGLARMREDGYHPALVVETSPGNFQAWLNHGRVLSTVHSTAVAKALAERFGGDPGSADWRHFGRLAGFTNRKQKYQQPDGLYPFVRLSEATGSSYPRAQQFVDAIVDRTERVRREAELQRQAVVAQPRASQALRSIEDFRAAPSYAGDGHRIDLAYAVYALSHRVPEAEVRAAIESRDLSHKGNQARQEDYIQRTLSKAMRVVDGQGRGR